MPEQLPRGAQFTRSKMLWEIALGVAGDPSIPYFGNRDVAVFIGNGSQAEFRPSLRMAPGSPILAKAVVAGDLDCAFVNPSAMLTQAYRGTGLYTEPLDVRVIANYPSWDRFVIAVNPKLGLTSLRQLADEKRPVRVSIREDMTHSTRVLVDQMLPLYGFTLADIETWGGSYQTNGGPGDPRRLAALRDGSADIVFDEGIVTWLNVALENGYQPLEIDGDVIAQLEAIGWRRAVLPQSRYSLLAGDSVCIDYSGWPLYTRASLPDDDAYRICAAIAAREAEIPWDEDAYTGLDQLGRATDATPIEVPLHPGAMRWYREQGYEVYEG
jgi:TRAP-type uncharacterized transport system substrate-binding protein